MADNAAPKAPKKSGFLVPYLDGLAKDLEIRDV